MLVRHWSKQWFQLKYSLVIWRVVCTSVFQEIPAEDAQARPCLQRIIKVDYEFPENVRPSAECQDLIQRMLVPEPEKRATIKEIQNHPWYQVNLPQGLVNMNDKLPPPHAGQVFSLKMTKDSPLYSDPFMCDCTDMEHASSAQSVHTHTLLILQVETCCYISSGLLRTILYDGD